MSGLPTAIIENGHPSVPDSGGSSAPFVMFCLYTFILVGRPQDYFPAIEPLRPALVLTILTAVVTAFYGWGKPGIWRSLETKLYLVFSAILCAGIPFSIYRRASFNFVILRYVVNVAFYLLFLVHVDTLERFKKIAVVVTLSTLAFNLVWMAQGGFVSGRYSGGSQMFDPNDIAFVEVSLLSVGLGVVLGGYRALSKVLALLMVLTGVLLVLYAASRGGAIALGAWFALFLVVRIARVSKARKLMLVAVVVALAVWNADKINVERYMTLTTLQDDYNVSDEFGRTEIWRRGLEALMKRPLTGVGADCFGEAIAVERDLDGRPAKWQAAHNSFVQVATEAGVIGGAVFLFLIGVCLVNFNRLRRRRTESQAEAAGYAAAFLIGFVALIIAAFFLSQAYSMMFTLYFALSAALKRIGATVTNNAG